MIVFLLVVSCAPTVSLHFEPEKAINKYCKVPYIGNIHKLAVLPFENSRYRKQEIYYPPTNSISRVNVSQSIEIYSFFDDDGKYVTDICERELSNSNKFKIVDRRTLENVFNELKLNMSGILDESNLKEFGKLSGADAILSGKVIKAFSQKQTAEDSYGNFMYLEISFVSLEIRLVNVETGDVLWNCTLDRNSYNYLPSPITISNTDILNGKKVHLPNTENLLEITCVDAIANILK